MKKTFSISEIEKELAPELTAEDIQTLSEGYRKGIDREAAADIVANISAQITAKAESDPDAAREIASWSLTDKLLFIVREVYTLGAVHATKTTSKAIAHAAAELVLNLQKEERQ